MIPWLMCILVSIVTFGIGLLVGAMLTAVPIDEKCNYNSGSLDLKLKEEMVNEWEK